MKNEISVVQKALIERCRGAGRGRGGVGGADRAGLQKVSRYAETQSPSDAAAEEHQAAQGQPRTDHMTAGTGVTLTPPPPSGGRLQKYH